MFHLLVKFNGWSQGRDTIRWERVFEYTDDAIVEQFKPSGVLDNTRISSLPALFVSETLGSGKQVARVGYITQTRLVGKEMSIEYTFDDNILPIPNSKLESLAADLTIQPFEFSRGHWAIKDVDLFKVLFRNRAAGTPFPKLFNLNALEEVDDGLISVMMPFDARFDAVYAILQEATKAIKLRCLRADDIWESAVVIQDVVSLICRSRVVICDCTNRNANVFYETGIAHALGRDVILITQSESDIPFDLRHLRYLHYLNNSEGREQLAERLKQRIQTLLGGLL